MGYRAGMLPKLRPCDKKRCPQAKWIVDAAFAAAGITLTAEYKNPIGSICVVASWAAFCRGSPDAIGMLLFFALFANNNMVAAISFTGAYISWARIWSYDPWRATWELPNYRNLVAKLRPMVGVSAKAHGESEDEEDECLICRSADDVRQQLPCNGGHLVCIGCLDRLHVDHKSLCPFCLLPF